jgi:carboxypeptidase C (cathepsin A)
MATAMTFPCSLPPECSARPHSKLNDPFTTAIGPSFVAAFMDYCRAELATEYVIDHLDLTPEQRARVAFEYYEAGYMMYIHEPSLLKFKEDLAHFVRESH